MLHAAAQASSPARASRVVNGSPIYYGWIVMLAATFGAIMTSPGQTYAVSIFIEHFIQDLGISRSLVSTLYTVGTLAGSAALPFIGRRIDRHGPRIMVVIIAVLFGLACILMGNVTGPIMLLMGFVLIRMLGQGSLGLVSNYTINQWWVRRRGAIIGISGVLVALLGVGSFPNLINWLIPQIGWRGTYIWLGIVLIAVMAPVGYIFYRSRPEQFGLLPDGASATQSLPAQAAGAVAPPAPAAEEDWTLHEATRTSAFWIVVAGLATIAMLSTGLTFHMVSIFADNQLSASAAAAVFVPIAIVSAGVNLGSGILVDRMPIRFLLAAALLVQAIALWLAQALNGPELAVLFGVLMGILFGMMRTISTVVWPTYYGRRHLGSITGLTSTIMIAGSALGPMPMGIARDLLGSYSATLLIAALLPMLLSASCLFIRRPAKKPVTG